MARGYAFESSVVLPRMSASEVHSLATALLTAADSAGALPESLKKPRSWLQADIATLERAAEKAAVPLTPSAKAQPTDRRLDTVLSKQRLVFEGFDLDEPENTKREAARALHDFWYGEGYWYSDSTYSEQWSKLQTRLEVIAKGTYDKSYAALGLTAHLEAIRRLHVEYGRVLGITAPAPEEDSAKVKDEVVALRQTIRRWVGNVEATVDRDDPETRQRADRLLLPLLTWASPSPTAKTPQQAPTPTEAQPA